ncbi:hypothetical protein ATOP_06270 [Granulimonas faecalis]|uniref:Uncharacterized protein n=1 Tax=Granulimonas faecalis TaxID=2894155 RepID=A0AAV5B144_9ACTN|nr:hypothetical protein ATOP_06270 [Granulimonas faecalis]
MLSNAASTSLDRGGTRPDPPDVANGGDAGSRLSGALTATSPPGSRKGRRRLHDLEGGNGKGSRFPSGAPCPQGSKV